MANIKLVPIAGRFWRMLSVRWHDRPFESGAHLTGGRWNRKGQQALYLARDYNTAIAELHQDLVRPGTLAAYDLRAAAIADLTDPSVLADAHIEPPALEAPWRTIVAIERGTPPSWLIADRLIAAGAEGALVPSVQNRGGVNLVLWRWHDARLGAGEGAALGLLDPHHELTGDRN